MDRHNRNHEARREPLISHREILCSDPGSVKAGHHVRFDFDRRDDVAVISDQNVAAFRVDRLFPLHIVLHVRRTAERNACYGPV